MSASLYVDVICSSVNNSISSFSPLIFLLPKHTIIQWQKWATFTDDSSKLIFLSYKLTSFEPLKKGG